MDICCVKIDPQSMIGSQKNQSLIKYILRLDRGYYAKYQRTAGVSYLGKSLIVVLLYKCHDHGTIVTPQIN